MMNVNGNTAWRGLVLSVLIGQFFRQVEGCVETFPLLENSTTKCSNLTNTCSVTCTSDHMFYDGNNTKNYSCNSDNVWTPSIPKSACLENASKVNMIQLKIVYFSSKLAADCSDAHKQSLKTNEDDILKNVSRLCNNDLVKVGNIVINSFTSNASRSDLHTTIQFLITNSSTRSSAVNSCALILRSKLQIGELVLHEESLNCSTGISNINKKTDTDVTSQVRICRDFYVLMKNAESNEFCVQDLPILGVRQLQYRVNIADNVVLYSDILFGSYIHSVQWMHDNETITTPTSPKYSGSNVDAPSLTIMEVTYADAGNYTCHVFNNHGTRSGHTITLIVFPNTESETSTEKDTTFISSTHPTDSETALDSTTVSTVGSSKPISTTKRYEQDDGSDKDNTLYIAIGAGCGGLVIIIVITIIVIQSCRKSSHPREQNNKERETFHSGEENNEPEYDGLKDNILYVKSDDSLKDNILYVPSEEHDIADGNYSSVDLEHSTAKRVSVDGNYTTVDLESPRNNPGSSHTTKGSNNTNETTEFVNQAFEINDGDITHIAAPDGTSNVYAVVNKKKNSVKNSDDQNISKPEITYAVVNKTTKSVSP